MRKMDSVTMAIQGEARELVALAKELVAVRVDVNELAKFLGESVFGSSGPEWSVARGVAFKALHRMSPSELWDVLHQVRREMPELAEEVDERFFGL